MLIIAIDSLGKCTQKLLKLIRLDGRAEGGSRELEEGGSVDKKSDKMERGQN